MWPQWTSTWYPNTRTCFSLAVALFLDTGTCFSQQYARSEQPGNSWTPGTALHQWTSLSCGMYLRNVSTVPRGIRTSHLWWCFVVNASLLSIFTTLCHCPLPSQFSLHPQFAFKIFSQGLHLKKPKLKQNKTISHLSGGGHQPVSTKWISLVYVFQEGTMWIKLQWLMEKTRVMATLHLYGLCFLPHSAHLAYLIRES